MNEEGQFERRKHERFHVQEGALAVLGPHFRKMGQIMDISWGGLSFRYVARDEPSEGQINLNISLPDGTFRFHDAPFQTVWDSSTPYDFSFGAITFGQCGVRFGQLSDVQTSQLEYFMHNYTENEVDMQEPTPYT